MEVTPLPTTPRGMAGLVAAGRVQPARRSVGTLARPVASTRTIEEVLEELRAER
ncbi:MAG: hypothetical protein ABIS47_14340 [Acidimicrobiales bacterium]